MTIPYRSFFLDGKQIAQKIDIIELFHQTFKYLRAEDCRSGGKGGGSGGVEEGIGKVVGRGWRREEMQGERGKVLSNKSQEKASKNGSFPKFPTLPSQPHLHYLPPGFIQNPSPLILIFKIIMFTLNELIQAFDNNIHYAWQILYAEILMETTSINTEYLRKLVILYSKGVEKCNHLQNTGESYFKNKINQLMGQKKVIQCLHDDKTSKRHPNGTENLPRENMAHEHAVKPKMGKYNPALQARKKEIEMRLAYDIQESKTSKLSKMLKEEKLRQEKLQSMVVKCMSSQQEKLKRKIEQRKMRASLSGRMTASLKLQTSGISTYGQGIDSYDNLDTILDEISFISTEDHYV